MCCCCWGNWWASLRCAGEASERWFSMGKVRVSGVSCAESGVGGPVLVL